MNWLQFAVQWLHVLLGILWFGFALSMHFIISPALAEMPEAQQQKTTFRVGEIGGKVFPVVGILILLLGIIRGTLLGPIDSFADIFGTAYGITWLVALLATVALFITGARFIAPTFARMKETDDFPAAAARLRRITTFDLGLFFVIFTCMVLMRFGL